MNEIDALERALRAERAEDTPLPDLTHAVQAAGLLDIAYATLDSPVGPLLLATSERGLLRVAYLDGGSEPALDELAAHVSPRILEAPRRLDEPRRELDEYFAGRRDRFELPIDWALVRGFARRVLQATAQIPYGSVSTYKQIATDAGSPRAFRAAGNALGSNPIPIVVPCHRVLHSGGGLGGYTGGLERKRLLLTVEGVLGGAVPRPPRRSES
jgi:methylated-DNA-[protein]-cysteine S-methyltransferase